MTIVYCIPQLYNAGGMERVLTQKVNFLATIQGIEITIVTTERTPDGKAVSYFPLDNRVRLVELNIDFDADFRAPILEKYIQHQRKQQLYRKKLKQILIDQKAHVCISLCGKEIDWLGKLTVPCRKIAEIHFAMNQREQLLAQYHSGVIWHFLGYIRTRQLQRAVKKLDRLVVLTYADEKQWNKAGVLNTICIPNPSPIVPDNIGEHGEKEVLAVGRLHPQKGFDMLLQAWKKIAKKHEEWTLRIVGEGEEKKKLLALAYNLGISSSVEIDGLSSDIMSDYRNSGLFVLSSRYEGMPLALMEAMSCGSCCVAFDCPCGPSELITNGKTGMLIPAESIDDLAGELERLMDCPDRRKQLGEAAYIYAKEHFSLEPVMQQWLNLLEI